MTLPGGVAPADEAVVLSPEWLTALLGERHPGAVVTKVEVTERIETVATKVRFRVEYAEEVAGAPTALCAKGYFNPDTRRRGSPRQEADFYRLFANDLPVRTPPWVHAAIDEETGHPLVVMRDLVPDGVRFGDPLAGFTPEQAAGALDQIAALHAATTGEAKADEWAAVFPPRLTSLAKYFTAERLQAQLDDGRAEGAPAEVLDGARLHAAMGAMARIGADLPRCLVHGDVHTGNMYTTADGEPGIIDWQVVQYGAWALDVAYHMASVLDPDDLAEAERGLLDHYLDRLAAHGGTPPTRDEAWRAYREHLPYGYYMWGITRNVHRPITERHTRRLAHAVARHGSLDLLGV
ncbi:MAG TPA: phosphotransferase [Yinghuangia sp.]|nr:phosphotransferase [Yinghuangia sp.]